MALVDPRIAWAKLAAMADHTSTGTAYLPASQITAWGRGIALVAKTLTG